MANETYQKINWGWLNDYNGYKFAPITFVEQLYTVDGYPFLNPFLNNLDERFNSIQTTISAGTVNNSQHLVGQDGQLITTATNQPVYFSNGIPIQCEQSSSINIDLVGNVNNLDNYSAYTVKCGTLISNSISGDITFTNKIETSFTGDITGTLDITGSNIKPNVTLTLIDSGVTANSYGPSADATLNHAGTFTVPQLTVDSKGRITGATNKTFTLPEGNKVSITQIPTTDTAKTIRYIMTNSAAGDEAQDNALKYYASIYVDYNGDTADSAVLMGGAWNDFAEFRNQIEEIEPGYCVASTNQGKVYKTTEKFQSCDGIVSDTYGFTIGKTSECQTPLAVSGRVLAYFNGNREDYSSGDTVCAGPDGKICKMTREEIREYPDKIIGIVSEIPEYEEWNGKKVNNRIWIKVK